MNVKLLATALLISCVHFVYAQDSLSGEEPLIVDEALLQEAYQAYIDSFTQTLQYELEEVDLKYGLASIVLPKGYKYLNGEDSEKILTDIWGNPPSEEPDRSLGMLMPANNTPFTDSSYVINITYSEEGYVDDSDASDIDYDELLESMQEEAEAANEARIAGGYPTIEIVGWASPPYYDATNKKLHWAKEIKFGESEMNTLNYNIRILGRRGYLQLNVIGEMYVLNEVKASIDPVINSVNFEVGNTYADFDPDIDQVAAYGIGALIAGKVLTKAGIFAKLGIFLAKFWKIIAIGAIALLGGIKKFFGGKSKTDEPA